VWPGIVVGVVRARLRHRARGEPRLRLRDDPLGLGAVHPAADVGGLTRLEFLVDVEEVADLVEQVLRDVGQVPDPGLADVVRGDPEDLRVRTALVGHPEDSDRAHGHQAAGEGRLLQPDEHVDRLAVLGEGPQDLAVVHGVDGRGEQHPVQPDALALGIELVLVARPLRGFDNDLNVHTVLLSKPPAPPPPGAAVSAHLSGNRHTPPHAGHTRDIWR